MFNFQIILYSNKVKQQLYFERLRDDFFSLGYE